MVERNSCGPKGKKNLARLHFSQFLVQVWVLGGGIGCLMYLFQIIRFDIACKNGVNFQDEPKVH